jgi:hypothetical protein
MYRQLSIAITEKYMVEVHRTINRFDDKSPLASASMVYAWQSGHRPVQRGADYGLNGLFPTKIQP